MYLLSFVWRQLGFAFVGAPTPVGALFILERTKKMEEKILIKSETNKIVKAFLQFAPPVLLGIAALISILFSIPKEIEYERYSYYTNKYYTYTETVNGWRYVFRFGDYTPQFIWFVIGCLCLLSGIVIGIIYLVNRKCEIQITENNVKGKTLLGKEVVLPLYMVSAYSTRKFLSMIAVATASGITKFSLIGNYKEIGEVLSKKINERQQNTETSTKQTADNAAMDDILKLKSLLDSGIISQEEFEAKKKQLLGL